jgi:hypothetical protein
VVQLATEAITKARDSPGFGASSCLALDRWVLFEGLLGEYSPPSR